MVYNNVTNTKVTAGLHPVTFINAFYSKSVILCLGAWRTFFNHPTIRGHHFLTLRSKNYKSLHVTNSSP